MFYIYNTKSRFFKIMYWVLPIIAVILLFTGYMAAVEFNPLILPMPMEVARRFISMVQYPIKGTSLWVHVAASLLRVLIGAFFAWGFGILFGVLIAWNRKADAVLGSVFNMLRSIPPIAWIPIIVMSFGIGEFSKVLLVFIGCFVTMVVNTYDGVKMVNHETISVGRIFGANEKEILYHIVIPTALPSIFTGVRNTISGGWRIIVAAEMMGASTGVGSLVTRGWNELDMAMVLVCIIMISITGVLLALAIAALERRLTPWER